MIPSSVGNTWMLQQFVRLTKIQPSRAEDLVARMCEQHPDLYLDLLIGAVDQELLPIEEASELTGLGTEAIESLMVEYRRGIVLNEGFVVCELSHGGTAKIGGHGVAVWEVVREARRTSGVDELTESFPTLTKREIQAALDYAEIHGREIDEEIERYEALVQRKRNEYPNAN